MAVIGPEKSGEILPMDQTCFRQVMSLFFSLKATTLFWISPTGLRVSSRGPLLSCETEAKAMRSRRSKLIGFVFFFLVHVCKSMCVCAISDSVIQGKDRQDHSILGFGKLHGWANPLHIATRLKWSWLQPGVC